MLTDLRQAKAGVMREREALLQQREAALNSNSSQKARLEALRAHADQTEAKIDCL